MKVQVREIAPPYTNVPTKSLEAILRNHAHDKLYVRIRTGQLYDIMGVLAERNEASGPPLKTAKEAWAEFKKYYMPRREDQKMDYKAIYDAVLELQEHLTQELYDAEIGCVDYKIVKVLAAAYELQDYLANQIARHHDLEDTE